MKTAASRPPTRSRRTLTTSRRPRWRRSGQRSRASSRTSSSCWVRRAHDATSRLPWVSQRRPMCARRRPEPGGQPGGGALRRGEAVPDRGEGEQADGRGCAARDAGAGRRGRCVSGGRRLRGRGAFLCSSAAPWACAKPPHLYGRIWPLPHGRRKQTNGPPPALVPMPQASNYRYVYTASKPPSETSTLARGESAPRAARAHLSVPLLLSFPCFFGPSSAVSETIAFRFFLPSSNFVKPQANPAFHAASSSSISSQCDLCAD